MRSILIVLTMLGASVTMVGVGCDSGADGDGDGDVDGGSGAGVGAACLPEAFPAGGFLAAEVYLETSSSQCSTGVCVVYQLEGDPHQIVGSDSCVDEDLCTTQDEVDERVYCTCRCLAPDNSSVTLCDCPSGFDCLELTSPDGSGSLGSFCVRAE